MDRSVLEGDPHAVLEAMAIAGYAIGSDQGYILRARRVPHRPSSAWRSPSSRPANTASSARTSSARGFNFNINIRLGAGAFVCGEERR